MSMVHDPSEYIRGLQQLLISDKKRIGFLFGAGTSMAEKDEHSLIVPAIGPLTNDIVKILSDKDPKYKTLFEQLEEELGSKFNIETILTNLEQKCKIIGKGLLNGLDQDGFINLITNFKEEIRDRISIHTAFTQEIAPHMVQTDFARWVGQIHRKYPVEIFTTNYDYLFELGLEYCNVPYYDGFTGSFKPFFNSSSVEEMNFLPKQTKLWKIHGSLGWHIDETSQKIIRTNSDDQDILIYPSVLKYNDSKKQPYESLMDRLSNFLKTNDSILIVSGYSFGDEHINARVEAALNSNTTSHVIFLLFDKYWCDTSKTYKFALNDEHPLYKFANTNNKISVYGMRNAIIGGKYGEWQLKNQPDKDDTVQVNLYFDEDFDDTKELGAHDAGTAYWSGKGDFILPDFKRLVGFLSSVMPENEIAGWAKYA
ncbi:MAG: SIR2 family protein [Sulfuricurvum sp.]|jgi:hypothetical protein|uniref:SIR2 family protein n=1 Tax=Sulfuricurvum sp. TaxID=2025608 RepID=UPI0025EF1B9A|nr:SIR2 family protein [Sulfuricurvum sp.]MCK9372105.1 SIR2 family protein [Sulfuricurvum sp.]